MAGEQLRLCFDRVIPDDYAPARAMMMAAVVEQPLLDADEPIAARAAAPVTKKWPNGSTISCRFLDGSDVQRAKAQEKAKEWEDFASITFQFVETPDEQIRISFQADPGSWSAVGTDCLIEKYFPRYQPTMNFGWLKDDTDDDEWRRVVVHEFGHALGLIHEHQAPTAHLQWNTAEVYRVFSGPPNFWSRDQIDTNIIDHYGRKQMNWTAFDLHSIMLYAFPGSLFVNGVGTPTNTDLSKDDKRFVRRMYPGR